jgi:hypothetical protein
MKHRVISLTTGRVCVKTRVTVLLHWRNTAEGEIRMTDICTMSSTAEMHAARSKTGVRSVSALNMSGVKRGTIITMVPIMTNLTDNVPPKDGAMQRGQTFPMTLRG